jgi:hypothetical protein
MVMSARAARIIDPILTGYIRGYENNDLVGKYLFPEVPVPAAGGQILQFGKEAFILYATQRAPGGNTARMEIGYLGLPYACENHALEAKVPDELSRDAQQVPGIDLQQNSVGAVWDSMLLKLEYQQSQVARNPGNYGINNKMALSGAAQWSATTSTPRSDVQAARMAIRAQTGKYPNVMVLPPGGCYKLGEHPAIKDRFKFTTAESLTLAMLAKYFEVDLVVEGNSVYVKTLDSAFSDCWGNDVVLAYVPKQLKNQKTPSFGYTYALRGHPFVKQGYYENNCESWIYGVKHERSPVIAGADAGFLIQNAFL